MTLSQQAAILLEAVDQGLSRDDNIIRWADSVIVALERPAAWLVELSTLDPSSITEIVNLLRKHANDTLPLHWRVQIIVLEWDMGFLSFEDCLPKLFQILIVDDRGQAKDSLDERLIEVLVDWDMQEDFPAIGPKFRSNCEALFRKYLADAQEISAILRWKRQ